MRIVVMGAGLIGVTSAYYLARDGHQVIVIDRQQGPARETSFATACLLTPSHTMAWARPKAIWEALTSVWNSDSAVVLRPRFSRHFAKWSWRFLGQCTDARYRANTLAKHHLARYSLSEIQRVSREHGLAWDNVDRGVLILGRDARHLEAARRDPAPQMRVGIEIWIGPASALEPAFGPSRLKLLARLTAGRPVRRRTQVRVGLRGNACRWASSSVWRDRQA
jgi:D-amino-acid dehydrogenase